MYLSRNVIANNPDIEITRPVIVGRVAFETPEAIALGFPVPVKAMTSKTSIIPVTVPSSPSNGQRATKPLI